MRKQIYIFLTALIMVCTVGASGQNSVSDLYLNAGTDDFATIRNRMNQYFAANDQGKGSGYKQWKRWEYLAERRLSPDGKVVNWSVRNFQEYQDYLATQTNQDASTANNGYWTSLGPTSYTWGNGWNGGIGRLNCIAFHPSNSSVFWVGGPSSGLWKTTNGGSSWTCLTDGMPVIGVSGIAVNYNNTNIMYILTGDGDGGDTYSIGVLKSTDGGDTWNATGLSYTIYDNIRGYKLLMHPTNSSILFVVSTDGIFRTADAGTTWTEVQNGSFRDIEFKPGDPTIVYASGQTSFWKSTNSGTSFTQISSGVPTTATRIAIGVTPDDPTYVYLLTGPATATGVFKGVYRSTNSGTSFSSRSTTPNILGYSSTGNDNKHQTTYDLAIAVRRTDAEDVMIGGINTWVSTNGGTNWTITSMWDNTGGIGYTHADIHNLEINPLNNYLYCVSDGGCFRSTDFGSTWTDLSSGLAITQWYRIAGYQANVNLLIGGTQDNGSNKWTGTSNMLHVLGADGMDCMIDHSNSNILYNSTQDGGLAKSTNGGTSYTDIQPAGSTGSWVTPYVMSPGNSSIIYGGYDDVYKSTNGGASWSNMGVDGRGAMAIGTSNTSRVYASNGSTIYRSDDAASTWTNISAGLPGVTITFIAVNPDNSLEVYVTLGGYTSGQKVYRSTNGGSAWTNISGTLPNIPTNCIAFEDTDGSPANAVYVGNDIGIFYRDADHSDWVPFRNGLPTVPVFDLEINNAANVITAATYGRGLWRSELYTSCPTWYYLTQGNNPSNTNSTGYQFYESGDSLTSSRIITGGIGTDVTYKAANYIRLTTGFNAREDNLFKAKLGPCGLGTLSIPGVIPVTGTFTGQLNKD
jgi:hypothetical protein